MFYVYPMPFISWYETTHKGELEGWLRWDWEVRYVWLCTNDPHFIHKIVRCIHHQLNNTPNNSSHYLSSVLPFRPNDIENMPSTMKRVSFSETSILVVLPKCSSTSMWYQDSDMESFKDSYERSVAEIRYRLSRGDIHGSELLGMEKHLTQDVSWYEMAVCALLSFLYMYDNLLTYNICRSILYSCSSQENTLYAEGHYRVQF